MSLPSLLVDLRVAQTYRERGIARYSQSLILALTRERPELQVLCMIDPKVEAPSKIEQLRERTRLVHGVAQLREDMPEITHFLQSGLFDAGKQVQTLFPKELSRFRPRLAAIVYDLIPWLFPEAYLSQPDVARDYLGIMPVFRGLDRMFTISESVRCDVIAIGSVDPSRVVTINGGFDADQFRITPADDLPPSRLEGISLPATYWLYVGGDDFRKNLPRLLEAFGLLKVGGEFRHPLVVACSIEPHRRSEFLAYASTLGLSPGKDVIFTGYVEDATLAVLYLNCIATVFPSLYEGLGLPVLESYASGKCVLTSDTSSLRDLVPERCRFDPYSARSMADAILRFQQDPTIAEESLAFGKQAVARHNWSNAARKLGEWLDPPSGAGGPLRRVEPLWVATSLPPDKSGVAFVTQRSLGAPAAPVAFFAPVAGRSALEAAGESLARARHAMQRECAPADILPITALAHARRAMPEKPVVFVLGNSDHHLATLTMLMEYGARPGDAVHLHDVFIGGLLFLYFGTEPTARSAMLTAYPSEMVDSWWDSGGAAQAAGEALDGPRFLARTAGVRHFIVNSAAASERLSLDLREDAYSVLIDVAFHPVLTPATDVTRLAARTDALLRIGHFGILGPNKQPDRLIAACDILARRRQIELVLAGYEVRRYVSVHRLARDYLRLVEAPSDDELQAIMASVDCAVQLRYPDHGESSGVVNQLLGLRRPVICTRTGSFAELGSAVHLVPPTIGAPDLAGEIEHVSSAGWTTDAEAFIAEHSAAAFEARLREFIA